MTDALLQSIRLGRLWVPWLLDPVRGLVAGGLVEWRDGRWSRIEPAPRAPGDLPPACVDAHYVLTPGLLNAHTHLDYSLLHGDLPAGQGFAPWLRAMIQARRIRPELTGRAGADAAQRALAALLADGVTAIWDIDSLGHGRALLRRSAGGHVSYAELIAPSAEGWRVQWEAFLESRFNVRNPSDGLSPHAPYTVVPAALAETARWTRERGTPLAIHLAESPEEHELLVDGRGALRDLLAEVAGRDPSATLGVGRGAIARAEAAGLLGPATLAVHCNLPAAGDIERVVQSRAVVVFCPGSHRFFGYPRYPLRGYRRAGVRLALGTDSLASNASLSIRREASLLWDLAPGLAPREVLALATGSALGSDPPYGARGRLQTGLSAEWALWRLPAAPCDEEDALRAILAGATCVATSAAGVIQQGNTPGPVTPLPAG